MSTHPRYDSIGHGYATTRREEPRFRELILAALGDSRSVVNVGAGAGSYEPRDRYVVAIEPSDVMAAQRPRDLVPALRAPAQVIIILSVMAQENIDLDLWRDLYEIASRVRALAPWTWMEETDIFGVEMPEDAGPVFVSVMGALGEHYAVAVYPNAAAMTALWAIHKDEHASPEQILEIPQIQLSFETRKFLEREDLGIIKQLGLKFRGENAWPKFRSYRPGFAPWFLEKSESTILRAALKQLLDVGPRLRVDPSPVRASNPETYLVRAPKPGSDGDTWMDEFRNIPPVNISIPRVLPDADAVKQCYALPKVENGIEVDFFLVRVPIGDGKARPIYPYSLLIVESTSGAIVGQEMLAVQKSMNDLLCSVPSKLIDLFKEFGVRPARLTVRPGRLADIIRPTCEAFGIELRTQRKLPKLDPARKGMLDFLARG